MYYITNPKDRTFRVEIPVCIVKTLKTQNGLHFFENKWFFWNNRILSTTFGTDWLRFLKFTAKNAEAAKFFVFHDFEHSLLFRISILEFRISNLRLVNWLRFSFFCWATEHTEVSEYIVSKFIFRTSIFI